MKYLLTCFTLSGLMACNDDDKSVKADSNNASSTQAFPVSSFFSQQIHEVDSLKLPTVKYTDAKNRKDTTAISLEEFKSLAREFVESDITKSDDKAAYKENSFADQSIPSITLNYTTDNPELKIQRVDVILDPNPVEHDRVKTVYIEKYETNRDTIINKKLYWKANRNFQVITSKKVGTNPEIITQLKVAWDDSDQY